MTPPEAAPSLPVVESRAEKISKDVDAIKQFEGRKFGIRPTFKLKSEAEAESVVSHAKSLLDLDASREISVKGMHDGLQSRLKRADAVTLELLSDAIQQGIRESIEDGDREGLIHSVQVVELLGLRSLLTAAGKRPLGIHRIVGFGASDQREYLAAIQKLEKRLNIPRLYPYRGISRRQMLVRTGLTGAAVGLSAAGVNMGLPHLGDILDSMSAVHASEEPKRAKMPRKVSAAPASPTPDVVTPTVAPTREPASPTPISSPTATVEKPTPTPTATEPPTPQPPTEKEYVPEHEGASALEKLIGREVINKVINYRNARLEAATRAQNPEDPELLDRVDPDLFEQQTIVVAFLGTDATRQRPNEFREDGRANSDLMMVAQINYATNTVLLESVPRDIFIPKFFNEAQDVNQSRLNAMSFHENMDQYAVAQRTLEELTGSPIDVVTKFNIDFLIGDGKNKGVVDQMFPNGVPLKTEETFYDAKYPTHGYGREMMVVIPRQGKPDLLADMSLNAQELASVKIRGTDNVDLEKKALLQRKKLEAYLTHIPDEELRKRILEQIDDAKGTNDEYTGLVFIGGDHRLTGETATIYARTRQSTGGSTGQRQSRQTEIMDAMFSSFKSEARNNAFQMFQTLLGGGLNSNLTGHNDAGNLYVGGAIEQSDLEELLELGTNMKKIATLASEQNFLQQFQEIALKKHVLTAEERGGSIVGIPKPKLGFEPVDEEERQAVDLFNQSLHMVGPVDSGVTMQVVRAPQGGNDRFHVNVNVKPKGADGNPMAYFQPVRDNCKPRFMGES